MEFGRVSLALVGGEREVRRIGFGTMAASGSYGAVDPDVARTAVRAALEHGDTLIDTADVYGDGAAEKMIGDLRAEADSAIILTKVGLRRNPSGRFGVDIDGSPDYLREAVLRSRERLRADVIDVVLLHRVDDRVPLDDSIGALGELVQEGVVRGIGLSEASCETIAGAHAIFPLTVVQSEFSLWSRDVDERGVLAMCDELAITFIASSPLGKGFLTGVLDWPPKGEKKDSRRKLPRFSGNSYAQNLPLLDSLAEVAGAQDATMAQVALAWVLARMPGGIAIPSTTSPARIAENAAADSLRLDDGQLATLDEAFAPVRVHGDRYPDMEFVNR